MYVSLMKQVTSAVGFSVEYFPQYKIVKNNIANETYVLYPCGALPPSEESIPAGAKKIQIPLTSLSAPETVPYAFVELLGLEDRVRDVSSFVTAPCGQKILSCGRESIDALSLGNETLLRETEVPYVDGILTTAQYPSSETFAFSASEDPGPLNRVEWVKFLGLFFNREKYASDVFTALSTEYNKKKESALQSSEAVGKNPVVAWISHFEYDDQESYQINFAEYKRQYTVDAGGEMLNYDEIVAIDGVRPSAFSPEILEFAWDGNPEGSFATQTEALESFVDVLKNVDVVIDETFVRDPSTYTQSSFEEEFGITSKQKEDLRWLKNNLVFREDGILSESGGLDWFEGAIARPDKVLDDMRRVVAAGRGEEVQDDFTWLRQIDEKPVVVTADDCERLASCDAVPTPICPFVSQCGDGSLVLLQNDVGADNAECVYSACDIEDMATGTAHMAAPAVVLLTVVIIFIEALVNWC